MEPARYPVSFSVDYPDRDLNRLTTFFRAFTVIPIAIIAFLLAGGSISADSGSSYQYASAGGALLVLPVGLMIIFRQKYPRWWFDWNLEFSRFSSRIYVYALLMDDSYPSTDELQSVHLEYPFPDVENELGRGMPIVKWLLAIPHYFILFFLYIALCFAVIGAWFAILFTGRYPRALFEFAEGVQRWTVRVTAYAFTLVTDRYPPFSLNP